MEAVMRSFAMNMADTKLLKISSSAEAKSTGKKNGALDNKTFLSEYGTYYSSSKSKSFETEVISGSVLASSTGAPNAVFGSRARY